MFSEAILIPVIAGITEGIKRTGIPSKFAALIAISVGIVLALFATGGGDAATKIVEGIILGLSASGLYSGGKAILK